MRTLLFAFFLAILTVGTPYLAAQQDQKFQLARSYEEGGDIDNAARLYLELYEQNKNSTAYFDGLQRTLLLQSKFSVLLPIVEERLQAQKTPVLYALLGNVHWKMGKTSSADNAWQQAIDLAPDNANTYALVAQTQIDNRVFDKAIATLLQGRKAVGQDVLFASELSQLYGAVNKFAEGTSEVLRFVEQSKNLSVAQGRISAYLITDQGIAETKKTLDAAVRSDRDNILLLQLYAWFLREIKDYTTAFELYRNIDDLAGGTGRELLAFADLARREGYYEPALRAYSLLIEKGKGNSYAMTALFGYARAMELHTRTGGKLGKDDVQKVIKLYRSIIDDFPGTQFAAESYFNTAALYDKELGETDKAIEEYRKLLASYSTAAVAGPGGIQLGLLYIKKNDIEQANATFAMVVRTYSSITTTRDEALFYLARLTYYQGNLDSAKEQFGRLAVNSNNDIANDALTMISLLEDNKEEPVLTALRTYAQAELREFQNNGNSAIELYEKAAAAAPSAPLAERCYFRMGSIEVQRNHNEQARAYFTALMQKYPSTIYGDQALLFIGDSYAAENNVPEALKAYTQLLEKYPRSTHLSEARHKIRKLRGDA